MYLIYYLISINVLALILFWFDKWMGHSGGWRIPELVLWGSAALGGSVGSVMGMMWFRHKTKKLSFQLVVAVIILLQAAVVAYLFQSGTLNLWLNQ